MHLRWARQRQRVRHHGGQRRHPSAGGAGLPGLEGADPARRNEALLRLSRILVPVNTTREPRFRHDTAYTVPPLPTITVAAELPGYQDDHMRRVAGVELMRGTNRLLAALAKAKRVVEAAL